MQKLPWIWDGQYGKMCSGVTDVLLKVQFLVTPTFTDGSYLEACVKYKGRVTGEETPCSACTLPWLAGLRLRGRIGVKRVGLGRVGGCSGLWGVEVREKQKWDGHLVGLFHFHTHKHTPSKTLSSTHTDTHFYSLSFDMGCCCADSSATEDCVLLCPGFSAKDQAYWDRQAGDMEPRAWCRI